MKLIQVIFMVKRHLVVAVIVNEIGTVVFSAVLMLALAAPFSWLWNRTAVIVFHAGLLDYWRAVGLFLAAAIFRRAMAGIILSLTPREPK